MIRRISSFKDVTLPPDELIEHPVLLDSSESEDESVDSDDDEPALR